MIFFFCACVSTDSKGLSNPSEVEALREKVYASLEAYCKQKYPEQPGRYGDKWNRARPQTLVFRGKCAIHTCQREKGSVASLCIYLKIQPTKASQQIKQSFPVVTDVCTKIPAHLYSLRVIFFPSFCTYRFYSILMREGRGTKDTKCIFIFHLFGLTPPCSPNGKPFGCQEKVRV